MISPVLLIVFNRPDTTRQVFDSIKKRKVPKLYISADAPRKGNQEDERKCTEVREIVQHIDWECEVHYRLLDQNVGCGYGPSSAISWVLEHEDRVIILEDDCVPAQPFFDYCDYLLEKYKDDNRIWLISGRSHQPQYHLFQKYDYIFSRYGHSWGWATWKRCWDHFDIMTPDLKEFIAENGFENVIHDQAQAKHFRQKYSRLLLDENLHTHAWDFQAGFMLLKNSALTIVPSRNLIHNIGSVGTHSKGESHVHTMQKHEDYVLQKEPRFVMINRDYEELHFQRHINPKKPVARRYFKKLLRKVGRLLGISL